MSEITYKSSGVDIDKANAFVQSIGRLTKGTAQANVLKRRGSFGALYEFAGKDYKNPVLVSSTDGVGTKLLLAKKLNKHSTIGIDLVAMNVNDILAVGAKPLFFLDYIACGKLNPNVLKNVVKGIGDGCKQSGSALIGGETAEMPGVYKGDDYDLAGFAVGVVDKSKIIDGSKIKPGDHVIGLASSGLHSNGYSLVRKVLSISEQKSLGKQLLEPTRIYVRPVLKLLNNFDIKGIAHITGGAFYDKLTKILPKGLTFVIHRKNWKPPKLFEFIQKKGKISIHEMFRTFNMGIGMVLVVNKKDVPGIIGFLKKEKIKSYEIGEVIRDKRRIIIL